jgi:hypothetical protein
LKLRGGKGRRWVVDYSESFETRFYRHVEKLDGAWDVLESAISALEHNPYSAGEPLLDYDGEELWNLPIAANFQTPENINHLQD